MKSIVFAGLFAGLVSPAFAAHLSSPPPPVPANWTGVSVGIQGGYAWGDSTLTFPATGHYSDLNPTGGFVGLLLGYDYEFSNRLVLGVRGDVNWSDLDGGAQPISTHVGTQTAEGQMDVFGSVTGRVGYDFGAFMPYLTGGWAIGDYKHTLTDNTIPFTGSATKTYSGYTVGAGLDYMLSPNWVAGIEYRYTDYGSQGYAGGTIGTFNEHNVDLSTNDIRVSVSYKF